MMDLLTAIMLWGFAGILVLGMLTGMYYSEIKLHCKTYKTLEQNKKAKFHCGFRLINAEYSSYNDSGFTIGYDYCQTHYCIQCGVISHWKEGIISVSEYLELIKDDNDYRFYIHKLNELIKLGNEKYKLNRKLI